MDFPPPCEVCDPNDQDFRKSFGCGYDGYAGQGWQCTREASRFGKSEPIKTCPHYVIREMPFVSDVWRYYDDYQRGALGPIGSIPHRLYQCLRHVEIESSLLEAYLDREREEKQL